MRTIIAGIAVMLLAACGSSGEDSETLAEANASGEEASEGLETAVEQSNATPLEKEQALAMIEERHENYEKIGDAMKAVTGELRGENPNFGQVRSEAATIAELAPQVPSWFPAGTGPDVGDTEARADIWQQPEDFAAKAQAFQLAAASFNTAAQGTDLASIRSAHADLGKSCKNCHDLYREEE